MLRVIPLASLLPRLLGLAALLAVALFWCWYAVSESLFLLLPALGLLVVAYTLLAAPYRLVVDQGLRVLDTASLLGRRRLGRLDDVKGIVVRKEVRGSGKSRTIVHPVSIELGGPPAEVTAPTDYLTARRISEKLAKLLEVNITDSGTGEAEVRDYRTLDTRWVDKVQVPAALGPPVGRVRQEGDVLVLPRANPASLAVGLVLYLLMGFMLLVGLEAWAVAWMALIPVVCAALFYRYVSACLFAPRLVTTKPPLAVGALEEVRSDAHGLYFISDDRVVIIYSALREDEAEWVKAALARSLKAFS